MFEEWIAPVRVRLARAFAAAYGLERGQEALSEAMAYAWEHFDSLVLMGNPVGFLFRVGQSRSRSRRRPRPLPPGPTLGLPEIEPALVGALAALTERQRVCVVLVFGFEWTHQEVADLLGLSRSTVQNHVERGLRQLRGEIGVGSDA